MSHTEERNRAEEAAEWLLRLEDEPTAACKAALAAWVARSPSHMEQFLLVTAANRELAGLDPQRTIDVAELLARGEAGVSSIVPLHDAAPAHLSASSAPGAETVYAHSAPVRTFWGSHWRGAAALAAALLVLAVAIPAFLVGTPSQRYSTSLGEQRSIKLGDDSVVQLNTQSQVEVRLSSSSREVRLIEGEALFAVAHDPRRPFRVIADDAVIQAIGTQFNVYRHGAETTVAVVEGVVSITTPGNHGQRLQAGDVAAIGTQGRVELRPSADAAEQVVWRQRKLDFRGTELREVVRQFNRYNRTQMRIEDQQIARREVNGVFNADEPHTLLEFLAQDPQVRLEQRAGETVIAAR